MEEQLEEHGGVIVSGLISVISIGLTVMVIYAMAFINMAMFGSLVGG